MNEPKTAPNEQERLLHRPGRKTITVRYDHNNGVVDVGVIETTADAMLVSRNILGMSAARVTLRFAPTERIDPEALIKAVMECHAHIKGFCEVVCEFPIVGKDDPTGEFVIHTSRQCQTFGARTIHIGVDLAKLSGACEIESKPAEFPALPPGETFPDLRIVVAGTFGSGKTTAARLIAEMLLRELQASVQLVDDPDAGPLPALADVLPALRRKGLIVRVESMAVNRPAQARGDAGTEKP